MKTKQEIYIALLREYLSDSFPEERLESAIGNFMALSEQQDVIYMAMEEYGKQQYNQAIEDAAENARIKFIPFSDNMEVNLESILKLKKMIPVIYMEVTLNLMLNNGKERVVEQLVQTGEHIVKESKAGKYIKI